MCIVRKQFTIVTLKLLSCHTVILLSDKNDQNNKVIYEICTIHVIHLFGVLKIPFSVSV